MKRIIGTYFLMSSVLYSFAQSKSPNLPIDSTTHLIAYTEVVKVDTSLNKEELFGKVTDWIDTAFRYSNSTVQVKDKKAGKIVAKESMIINDGEYHYTITIFVKDARYKYVFTNFYSSPQLSVFQGDSRITDYGPCEQMINPTKEEYKSMTHVAIVIGSYQKSLNKILSQIDKNIGELILSLKLSLAYVNEDTKTDDW